MCDTMAIVEPDRVLFAKNSDRDTNEAQNLVWGPARTAEVGGRVQCTWIEIPEVAHTYATLLSQPYWMWGAEMGTNEHGLTIGNEAVFTKSAGEEQPGLLGMDLLRLALERAATAEEAINVITALLGQHGQGGSCSVVHPNFTYDNSFIVADPAEAFVLETAGRSWAIERIEGARSISNGLTIPDFAKEHSDLIRTRVSACRKRQPRTQHLAGEASSPVDLVRALQDHGKGRRAPRYALTNGAMSAPCMHAGGTVASSQTTASWVADLRPGGCRHWASATAAPCTGLFKPVAIAEPLELERAEDSADNSLWWRHERFHRTVIRNPAAYLPYYETSRADAQARLFENPPTSVEAFKTADALLEEWTARVEAQPAPDVRPRWVRKHWREANETAGLILRSSESAITP